MKTSSALLLCAALLPAAANASPPEHSGHAAMKDDTIPTTTVENDAISLKADFIYDATKQSLRIRYLLHNEGKAAVAMFDRGDSLAVAQGRLKAGAVAQPASESTQQGLVLNHRALALRKPAPTVPPVPLAARLAAGGTLGGDIVADTGDAARVRYCLGVMPFDKAQFSGGQKIDDVDLWRASFAVAEKQHLLCTPWFDLASRAFEAKTP